MLMARGTIVMLAAAVLVMGVCTGCNKFTPVRYKTIYAGQPQWEVEKTLGKPYAKFSDSWTYINDEPRYRAIIQFKDGRVTKKAWYDSETMGDHPDGDLPVKEGGIKVKTKTTREFVIE